MKYELQLNNGQVYTLSGVDFNITELTSQLNDNRFLFVNFSGILVNKNIVLGLFPILQEME